jgi:uncharacterized protein (TIGR03435 family)
MMTVGFLHDVLDHLWQTTAFAAAVALFGLAFRSTSARARFWLWMAASLKFLAPFGALVWAGRHLGWSAATPATLPWSFAIDEISRPFAQPRVIIAAGAPTLAGASMERWLACIWAAGAAVVLAHWALRWMRLRRVVGRMSPVTDSRTAAIAHDLARRSGLRGRVRLLVSESAIEPGVFGVFRPALVLPKGVLDRLTERQLTAVIGHEFCHIQRRDNLTALMHMIVQALFWFHPVVWWLGTQLTAERERACDEAVLKQFEEPQVYAQGILKVCEFYVEASVPCVAGVTGADLRKRIENIMNQNVGNPLSFSRRLILWAGAAAAIIAPIAVGVLDAPVVRAQSDTRAGNKQFEVASIKPMEPAMGGKMAVEIQMAPGGRFIAKGLNLRMLIQQAYDLRDFQISGLPSWASTDRYEINAKGEGETIAREDIRPMLQGLLADRFQLKIRRETKEAPVYNLVVAKDGPKLKESEAAEGRDQIRMGRGTLQAQRATIGSITNLLANQLGRAVIDKTGLTKRYDFKLEWTPDESQNPQMRQMHPDAPPPPPIDSAGPSIFTAVQEQLGLRLESSKGPVEVLVIEKVEKPTEN